MNEYEKPPRADWIIIGLIALAFFTAFVAYTALTEEKENQFEEKMGELGYKLRN